MNVAASAPEPDAQGVAVRQLGLVLACDHRVHNGVDALRWLALVVDALEKPECLLEGR